MLIGPMGYSYIQRKSGRFRQSSAPVIQQKFELSIESADPLRVGWDDQSSEHQRPSPVNGVEPE